MSIVSFDSVSYAYEDIDILDSVTFNIDKGDYVGLIGPNGSGKTTLTKIALGLITPQKGEVKLFDEDVSNFKRWNKIGYVQQRLVSNIYQFPITTLELVIMNPIVTKNKALEALDIADVANLKNSKINELSGGQLQRVFIARAMATKPDLLILDEPTTGVDSESQLNFFELLKKLNSKHKTTIILISHDIDSVSKEVNHLLCLNHRLVCHGRPQEILNDKLYKELYGSDLKKVIHKH